MSRQHPCHWAAVLWVAMLGALFAPASPASAAGLTPESPEVLRALDKAVKFLESEAGKNERLGARALIGLAVLKNGAEPKHPRVAEAVEAIQANLRNRDPKDLTLAVYDTGLAIIFLITLDSGKYEPEIVTLLSHLQMVQKPHGGWGYPDKETGDTSMTQYGVLCSWEAAQAGFRVSRDSVERVTDWLLKTQDPKGGFGYQGNVATSSQLVKQSGVRHSMAAAGLGSVYICANLLGLSAKIDRDEDLPRALLPAKQPGAAEAERTKTQIPLRAVREAQALGNSWMRANYRIDPDQWTHYYLYALERYWSFREAAEGERDSRWYNDGARYLIRNQQDDGSWKSSQVGAPVDTAFGVLFLLRSSKKSIEHAYYYHTGLAGGGRGLPRDTRRVEVRGATIVARPPVQSAPQLFAALADSAHPGHGQAAETLAELPVAESLALAAGHAEELRKLAAGGTPQARVAALRTLARRRNLDDVPILIQALSDPNVAVVREASRGLEHVSRTLTAFEVPEQLSPAGRQALIQKWRSWYAAVRPEADFQN